MIATPETAAFDRGVQPVLRLVLPEKAKAILKFRASQKLQKRIEELADKASAGTLAPDERAEYEGYIRANKFIAILQRQARQMTTAAS